MTDQTDAPSAAPDAADVASATEFAQGLAGDDGPAESASAPGAGEEGSPSPAPGSSDAPAPTGAGDVEVELNLPTLADLQETAQKQAQARAEQDRLMAPLREVEQRIDQKLQGFQGLPQLQELARTKPDEAIRALGADPGVVQQYLTKQKLAPDPVQALQRLLDERLQPIIERLQPQQQAPTSPSAPPMSAAKEVFASYVGGASSLLPKLSQMPSHMAADLGESYVMRAARAGINTAEWTDQQIALAVERELSSSTNGAKPPAANGQPSTQTTANGGPTSSAPRSITNGLAAEGTRAPPETAEERYADAVAFAQARIRAAE